MKKALSLVVILTLLCFPVSGFCSWRGVLRTGAGAILGAATAPVAAVAIGTAVGGVVSLFATPMAGVAAFRVTANLISAHWWKIAIMGGISGAFEGANGGHPVIAGIYGGAGSGVAIGAF